MPPADGAGAAVAPPVLGQASFTDGAMTLGPVRIALAALGRDGSIRECEPAAAEVVGSEIRLHRARGVVEWWRSLASGLEQGVTIDSRPLGSGELVLEMSVGSGIVPTSESQDVIALASSTRRIATYSHLEVLDATGARIPARMFASAGRIRIEVDDDRARYPLVVDPLVVIEEATLAPGATDAAVLLPVALDADGTRALVGTPSDRPGGVARAGSARVYVRTGVTWALEATFAGMADEELGAAVAMSGDGLRAVVGAPGASVGGRRRAGLARVLVRSGTAWTEEASLLISRVTFGEDRAGAAVAISRDGTRLLVGVPNEDFAGGSDAGSARVFARSGSVWTEEATLGIDVSQVGAEFGWALDLDATGARAIVGAPLADGLGSTEGRAHVFVRSATGWVAEAALSLLAPSQDDRFGTAVALTDDGSRAVVGVPLLDAGSSTRAGGVAVFVRSAAAWTHEALLPNDASRDEFAGTSVAISASGTRILVGIPGDDLGGNAGSARVFERSLATWTEEATLLAGGTGSDDGVGTAVELAADATRALVSVPRDVSGGSVRVFTLHGQGDSCADPAECPTGRCVDGVCCDSACGNGAADCQACSIAAGGTADGRCTPLVASLARTTECRAAADTCDAPEQCDPANPNCPSDAPHRSGHVCRPALGTCDSAEVCDGASYTCPGDVLEPPGMPCGGAGSCVSASTCTGSSPNCPGTSVAAAGTVCLPAPGGSPCDVDDVCDGVSDLCAPRFAPPRTPCGPPVVGECDTIDECTGASGECLPTFLSGVECRASAGPCDPAEACLGDAPTCPPDRVEPSGMACRISTDATCDPAEACDGVSGSCPTDVTMCAPRPDGGASDASTPADGSAISPATAGCGCRASRAGELPLAAVLLTLLCSSRCLRGPRAKPRGRRPG